MKLSYKVRKWAVEKLGGTMMGPLAENTFNVTKYEMPIIELMATATIEPCYETINGCEDAKYRLIQDMADMILEKHLYRLWIERNFDSSDNICMKVSVAKPPKEE